MLNTQTIICVEKEQGFLSEPTDFCRQRPMRRVTLEPDWVRPQNGSPALIVSSRYPIQNTPQPLMGFRHCASTPQRYRNGVSVDEPSMYRYTDGSPMDEQIFNNLHHISQPSPALHFQAETAAPLDLSNSFPKPRKISLPGSTSALQIGDEAFESSRQYGRIRKSVVSQSFPVKLHDMLSSPSFSHLIAWMPHGRAWKVLKIQEFEERVLPLYFRSGRYSSFMRQVTGWGFRRITEGPDAHSYYHELFMRGLPQLAKKIRRPKKGEIAAPIPTLLQLDRKPPPSSALSGSEDEGQEGEDCAFRRDNAIVETAAAPPYQYKAPDPEDIPEESRLHRLNALQSSLNSLGSFEGYRPTHLPTHAIEDDVDFLETALDPPPIMAIHESSHLSLDPWSEDDNAVEDFMRPVLHSSHQEHAPPRSVPVPLHTSGEESPFALAPIQFPLRPVYMPIMMPAQQAHLGGWASAQNMGALPTRHSYTTAPYENMNSPSVDAVRHGLFQPYQY